MADVLLWLPVVWCSSRIWNGKELAFDRARFVPLPLGTMMVTVLCKIVLSVRDLPPASR